MSGMEEFVGGLVKVELSGNYIIKGYLIDHGLDILVVNQYQKMYYIPLKHVQSLSRMTVQDGCTEGGTPVFHHPFHFEKENISFRKVLLLARGHFMEISVTGKATVHGYLTSIMNDYFVFHSPIHQTVFVTLNHLKWLMPYPDDVTPYALDPESIPHRSVPNSLPRTFKEQCHKLTGQLVVFDMGDHPKKIGQLKSVDIQTNMVELINADGTNHLINIEHLKTAYLP